MTEFPPPTEGIFRGDPWKLDHSFPLPRRASERDHNFAAVLAYVMQHHPDPRVRSGELPSYFLSLGCGTLPRDPYSLSLLLLADGRKPVVNYVGVDSNVHSGSLEDFWDENVIRRVNPVVIQKFGDEIEDRDIRDSQGFLPNVLLIRSPDPFDPPRLDGWAEAINHVFANNLIADRSLIIVVLDGDFMVISENFQKFWNQFPQGQVREVSLLLESDVESIISRYRPDAKTKTTSMFPEEAWRILVYNR